MFSLSSFHEHTYTLHIPQQLFLVLFTIEKQGGSVWYIAAATHEVPYPPAQAKPVPTAVPAHLKALPIFFQMEVRRRSPIDASSSQKRSRKIFTKSWWSFYSYSLCCCCCYLIWMLMLMNDGWLLLLLLFPTDFNAVGIKITAKRSHTRKIGIKHNNNDIRNK